MVKVVFYAGAVRRRAILQFKKAMESRIASEENVYTPSNLP